MFWKFDPFYFLPMLYIFWFWILFTYYITVLKYSFHYWRRISSGEVCLWNNQPATKAKQSRYWYQISLTWYPLLVPDIVDLISICARVVKCQRYHANAALSCTAHCRRIMLTLISENPVRTHKRRRNRWSVVAVSQARRGYRHRWTIARVSPFVPTVLAARCVA